MRPRNRIDASNSDGRRRFRRSPATATRHHHPIVRLTDEGVPAALPGAPPASPVVAVSADSRANYPWLPLRVIAGSVWHGPDHQRVKVDESGRALPWRSPPAP